MAIVSLVGSSSITFHGSGALVAPNIVQLTSNAKIQFTENVKELESPKAFRTVGLIKFASATPLQQDHKLTSRGSFAFIVGKDNYTRKELAELAQQAELDDFIVLFEIDATILGGSIYRFTTSSRDGTAIKFGNEMYVPADVQSDGWEWTGKGQAPTPKIRIVNTTAILTGLVNQYDDLLGATVTRLRTFARYLADGDSPNPAALFPKDVYRIERKATENKFFVEFELSNAIDQAGRQLPGRQILRDLCTHRYRFYDNSTGTFRYDNVTCPYQGGQSFDEFGDVCPSNQDKCGKSLSDCVLRFGNNELPFRGFPGVARVRISS